MSDRQDPPRLPLPFYDRPWRGEERLVARALWDWHRTLWSAGRAPGRRQIDWERVAAEVQEGRPVEGLPSAVYRAAREACRTAHLPQDLLAEQVRALDHLKPPVRFDDVAGLRAFVETFTGAHARLLARLAGATGRWQEPLIHDLAFGFFLVGRLAALPDDLRRDALFIPLRELERRQVTLADLRDAPPTPAVQRLLWQYAIRAREALAAGRPLIDELDRRFQREGRRCWIGALEVLDVIERHRFDVWNHPPSLSRIRRWRIRWQARFGRTVFGR
ncbi:MAG: phytoene synthase [Bacteroidetes bacterium]|nr:MAG: phytoene synthase [Bacteroidota bacterium]